MDVIRSIKSNKEGGYMRDHDNNRAVIGIARE